VEGDEAARIFRDTRERGSDLGRFSLARQPQQEKPVSPAIERIDQCVASTGVVRNVRSITAAT
jgi:hypothetical protein